MPKEARALNSETEKRMLSPFLYMAAKRKEAKNMSQSKGKASEEIGAGRNPDGTFSCGNSISTKYRKEYCNAMLEYFKDPEIYPTFELFAESIGVTNDTLLNWKGKYAHFASAYERCKNIQKGRTIEGGITGRYNPNIVKFMAINNFGMTEKNDRSIHFDISIPQEIDEEAD